MLGDHFKVANPDYAGYSGSEAFEPWQDHEWPEHCDEPAAYLGEVGERELATMSGGDVESFLREHDAAPTGEPITLEMVPPHAPKEGEVWDSTKYLADEFVGLMRDLDLQLDFSEQSLQTLEEMIEQQFGDWRPWRTGKVARKHLPVASLVGAYVGEVMIRHLGGHWGWMPDFDVAAVQLPSGTWTSPPAKAQERFSNGKEDDLVSYYDVLKTQA
jgi:Uncharacterised protein family (UPF0167)